MIRIISGVSYDKNDVATKGIRILRGGNINDLRVTPFSDDVYLPETYYDPDKQVQIDDVLIVASTGSKEVIGKAGYVIEPLENTQIGAFLRIVRSFPAVSAYLTSFLSPLLYPFAKGMSIFFVKLSHL